MEQQVFGYLTQVPAVLECVQPRRRPELVDRSEPQVVKDLWKKELRKQQPVTVLLQCWLRLEVLDSKRSNSPPPKRDGCPSACSGAQLPRTPMLLLAGFFPPFITDLYVFPTDRFKSDGHDIVEYLLGVNDAKIA